MRLAMRESWHHFQVGPQVVRLTVSGKEVLVYKEARLLGRPLGGTASNAVGGILQDNVFADTFGLQAAGTGTFASNAGSSGVGQSALGSAVGSTAAGGSGNTMGFGEVYLDFATLDGTSLNSAGAVDSLGSGEFSAAFSPDATKPTGGSGSGNGSLSILQSATGNLVATYNVKSPEVSAGSTGSGSSFGGGMGVGSTNTFGSAGATGSGESSGSAAADFDGSIVDDPGTSSFTGMGTATGNFDGDGESFFGGGAGGLVLQFP